MAELHTEGTQRPWITHAEENHPKMVTLYINKNKKVFYCVYPIKLWTLFKKKKTARVTLIQEASKDLCKRLTWFDLHLKTITLAVILRIVCREASVEGDKLVKTWQ